MRMHDALMRPSGAPFAGLALFSTTVNARNTDPETSKTAAKSLETRGHMRRLLRIYEEAGASGLTDEEAARKAGIPTAHKRCSDLRRMGWIKSTGTTRVGSSNRDQMVCAWVEVSA